MNKDRIIVVALSAILACAVGTKVMGQNGVVPTANTTTLSESATSTAQAASDAAPLSGWQRPSIERAGDRVKGGSVYDKYGLVIQLPDAGDFVVGFGLGDPVPGGKDPGGEFVRIYHVDSKSSLFLRADKQSGRMIEFDRVIGLQEKAGLAKEAFDSIASSAEVSAR